MGTPQPEATVERVSRTQAQETKRLNELAESWAQARAAERGQSDVYSRRNANASRGNASSNSGDSRSDNRKGNHELTVEATAYTAYCSTGCIGVTATGVDVSNTIYHEGRRVIAVDPDVIPLGSHVTVRLEDGRTIEATADDTGGDIQGNRIDVLTETRGQALEFGRQDVEVIIH
jgi:3D (Asp-Asp-Asp) domain-containing protein